MSSTPPGLPPQQPPTPPPNMPPSMPPPQQPPYMQAPPPMGMPPGQKKKTSPLVIILAIVGGIAVLGMATCTVGAFFLARTVRTVFDPELMRTNPGLAMAKMAVAMNPNLEMVRYNERAGTIAMKEKSTGKIVTFRFDPDSKRMVIVGDDGKEVSISATGDGANGSVELKSSEGTVKFGAGAGNKAPAWVPVYPGSSPEGTFASQTPDGDSHAFGFKTKDSASKVLTYYQDQLKSAGFNVTIVSSNDQGGIVQGEDNDHKRTLTVTVGTSGDTVEASVLAIEKK
jgi:hypothetical protein